MVLARRVVEAPEILQESSEKPPGSLVSLRAVSLGDPEFFADDVGVRDGEALHGVGEWNDHKVCFDSRHFITESLDLALSEMDVRVLEGVADHHLGGSLPDRRLRGHHVE